MSNVLLALNVITLMCSSDVKDVSNIRPSVFMMKLIELVCF